MSRPESSAETNTPPVPVAGLSCGPEGCAPADLGDYLLEVDHEAEESPIVPIQAVPVTEADEPDDRPENRVSETG